MKMNEILIGLEYEPELTCLRFPKSKIYVARSEWKECPKICYTDNYFNHIVVFLNVGELLDISSLNLELRTKPCPLDKLVGERAKLDQKLEAILLEISEASYHLLGCCIDHDDREKLGSVGIFLPDSFKEPFGFKHVNLSPIPEEMAKFDYIFRYLNCMLKPGDVHAGRLHIKVPYNFWQYEELVKIYEGFIEAYEKSENVHWCFDEFDRELNRLKQECMEQNSGPILLGYVGKHGLYHRQARLP